MNRVTGLGKSKLQLMYIQPHIIINPFYSPLMPHSVIIETPHFQEFAPSLGLCVISITVYMD